MGVVERARERAKLLEDLQNLVVELDRNEQERQTLLARRAAKVHALKAAGAGTDELQEVLGVSRGRVHQILRKSPT